VACWGSNLGGTLGDGTFTDRSTLGVVAGLGSVIQLRSHWSHTCAILTNGTLRCWGLNSGGQLGDGTFVNRATPVDVHLR